MRLFLSEHTGDASPGGLVYIRVADVRPVAAEFGVEVHDEGGSRLDIELVDPDGNRLRVGSPTGRAEPGYTAPAG